MRQLLLAATSLPWFVCSTHASSHRNNLEVETTSGTLIGHEVSNESGVIEFLGVRYAESPTDALRFAAPKAYVAPENTIFEASHWSSDCPSNKPPVSSFPNFTQPSGLRVWKNFAAQNNNSVSEDCLKLNIWTKDLSKSESGKPVLVFLHGGRFQIPGPHSPFYSGQYLAGSENVVVVTPNYRLGIFGFSGAPDIEANPTLLDHRIAVEWVRDNIAAFGGDPTRIVLVGQSAGAASVDYWSFAWKDDPIVSGLVMMSGTSLSFLPNTKDYARQLWYNVSQTVGCGGPDHDANEVISCVRSRNTSVLLNAAAKVPQLPTQALSQATFHPIIDSKIVFANYDELSESGGFARTPILVGHADYEHGWYRLAGYTAKLNFTDARWTLFTERAFACPASHTTRHRVKHGVPTWRYRYYGDWDNLRLYNNTAGLGVRGSGTYHGSDLNMLFGTAEDVSGLPNSPEEDATSKYIMGAWAAFARDSAKGLFEYGWPRFSDNSESLVRLAHGNKPAISMIHPNIYDDACPSKNDPLPGQGAF